MQVASGNVADKPFARTVFSLASNRFTGDLILGEGKREARVSLENGQVVAATSPSPADAPGRIALSLGLMTSSGLGRAVQAMQEDPTRDPIEILAELAKLSPEQTTQLRRQSLARAAARIFAMPDANFVVDNARSMRADAQVGTIDLRWLIYFGLRSHYSVERLRSELSAVGERALSLHPKAAPMLGAFGFADRDKPLLALLDKAMSLRQLVAAQTGVDEATTLAIVYALVASGYVTVGQPVEVPADIPVPRSTPTAETVRAKQPIRARAARPSASPRAARPSASPRAARPSASPRAALADGTVQSSSFVAPTADSTAASETRTLIKERVAMLDRDANHYSLLGIDASADSSTISGAYFQLAKRLHPDRLRAVGLDDDAAGAQRLFAAINKAFSVLSNPKSRSEYREILAAGGEKAYRKKQQQAEEMAAKVFAAEEHYRLGEMALRRDQMSVAAREFEKAVDLAPEEGEYLALFAWASYCYSDDKSSVESEAIQCMSSALLKAPKNPTVHLYNAKLLKLIGRSEAALQAFRSVLEISPNNREAELELRLMSKRSKGESQTETKGKKGLFGRKG